MFIVFEGGEGCGKTTQIKLLNDKLKEMKYDTIVTRNPGGDKIADDIRAILLDSNNNDISNKSEALLYFAARAQNFDSIIFPALKQNKIVLCDRFGDSTYVYQHIVKKSIPNFLFEFLQNYCTNGKEPDITFILDIDPVIGLMRSRERLKNQIINESRYEKLDLDFHNKIRNGFIDIFEHHGGHKSSNYFLINGDKNIEDISKEIFNITIKEFKKRGK